MNAEEIIFLIRNGQRTKAFERIYEYYPAVKKMILKSGGNAEDAKDIFQDSLLVFYRQALKPEFVLTSSVLTFLYSISQKMWFKKIRDYNSRHVSVPDSGNEAGVPDNAEELTSDYEKMKAVEKILNDLGEPCKTLLQLYYYEEYSMQEIATSLSYSSENTAKAQKYKCMERARNAVNEKFSQLKSMIL